MEITAKDSKYSYQIVYVFGDPDYIRVRKNISSKGFIDESLFRVLNVRLYNVILLLLANINFQLHMIYSKRLSFKLWEV